MITETEMKDTPNALKKTLEYFEKEKSNIQTFFKEKSRRKFVFLGCGSSYMLAKNAATIFSSFKNTSAVAIAAGDYLISPGFWSEAVKDSIIVTFSRSGRTSELVRSVKQIKEKFGCPVISVSSELDNDIMPMSDMDLTIDWCYDKSVCQTRTVANLYTSLLLLAAYYSGDSELEDSIRTACNSNESFQTQNEEILNKIAQKDWTDVVVLADGPVCGIAEEAALAFTEIAGIAGHHYHLLDYRHGPIVICGEKTLVITILRPDEDDLQNSMVNDIKKTNCTMITVSNKSQNYLDTAAHIQISGLSSFAAWGIPFIYIAQRLAIQKALSLGGNPDAPAGLDSYVTLA